MQNKRDSFIYFIFFLAIIFVAFILRFSNIKERGIAFYDEGIYLSETRFISEGFKYVLGNGLHNIDFQQIKSLTTGIPLLMAKPGYIFIVFLFSLFLGLKDYTLLFVSALFGILNLLIIFYITKKNYNKWGALLAMSIAAVSSYHVFYSTVGLPEMVGLTFFLLGLYFYFLSIRITKRYKYLILSGITVGYAFTCNWRWVLLPLSIVVFELFRLTAEKVNLRSIIKRIVIFAVFFLMPLLLFEIPYRILIFFKGELPFRSYFQQLIERYMAHKTGALMQQLSLQDSTVFLRYFWIVEGPIFVIALALGFIILIRDIFRLRRIQDVALFFLFFSPIFIFSFFKFSGYNVSRAVSICVPFTAVLIGRLLSKKEIPLLIYICVFLILISGFRHSFYIPNVYSGYRQAAQYINDKGYKKLFILDNEAVFRAYAGRVAYQPYDRACSLSGLEFKASSSGVDKVIIDFNALHSKYGQGYIIELISTRLPEAVFLNPVSRSFIHLAELYPDKVIRDILADPLSQYIGIYPLGHKGNNNHAE